MRVWGSLRIAYVALLLAVSCTAFSREHNSKTALQTPPVVLLTNEEQAALGAVPHQGKVANAPIKSRKNTRHANSGYNVSASGRYVEIGGDRGKVQPGDQLSEEEFAKVNKLVNIDSLTRAPKPGKSLKVAPRTKSKQELLREAEEARRIQNELSRSKKIAVELTPKNIQGRRAPASIAGQRSKVAPVAHPSKRESALAAALNRQNSRVGSSLSRDLQGNSE